MQMLSKTTDKIPWQILLSNYLGLSGHQLNLEWICNEAKTYLVASDQLSFSPTNVHLFLCCPLVTHDNVVHNSEVVGLCHPHYLPSLSFYLFHFLTHHCAYPFQAKPQLLPSHNTHTHSIRHMMFGGDDGRGTLWSKFI